jgi:hypothetical protein
MIYNGRKGYVDGSLNQATGTVLAMTKGPIKGRNWNYTSTNPSYSITITAGATGTVALQGTNDVAIQDASNENNPIEMDLLPTQGATWTDIQAATSTSATGSITVEYQFLRLVIGTQGGANDYVTQAWVRWA